MVANFDELPDAALVRMPTVLAVSGLSRPTIWRRERDGTFPAKVRIGPASVGWRVGDLRRWLAEPDGPLRILVRAREPGDARIVRG